MDDPSATSAPAPSRRPRAPLIRWIVTAVLALAVILAFAWFWTHGTLPRRMDSQGILAAVILVPLGLWIAVVVDLWAAGVLGKALARFGVLLVVLMLLMPFAYVFVFYIFPLATGGFAKIPCVSLVTVVMGLFLLGWLAAFVGLAVYAWGRRGEVARIIWLLVTAWEALVLVLLVPLVRPLPLPSGLGIAVLVAYLPGILALLLFAVGLYVRGRHGPAVAAFGLAFLFAPAMIAAAELPQLC